MLGWLRDKLRDWNSSPLTQWSVRFEGDDITTSDGSETIRRLPLRELRKVVVQTDDSGPWGADVLYSSSQKTRNRLASSLSKPKAVRSSSTG
jgi:hypothetical protein